MVDSSAQDYTQPLQGFMQRAGLSSFKALYASGVSRNQIRQLRRGQIQQLRVATLFKLSQVLQVPVTELLQTFAGLSPEPATDELTQVAQEYQRLQEQLQQQQQILWEQFQQQTLQTLESLLLQWPTAAHAARNQPQAPAVKLLPLLRPLEQLLASWKIETLGEVGQELPYDPQWQQLNEAAIEVLAGKTLVKVTHVGYRQGDRLLYRARVKAVPPGC